jgi:hypothetical protein
MHSRCIAHRSGRGLDKSRIQAYRWRRVYRRATGGCDGSTAGHWASSNPAFTISRRRCGTKPYTSSGSSRFPTMLLSLPPFGLRSGGRLEVICPELRPSRMAIHSMRRMAHSFPACRSSRLTCGDAGHSEDPQAQALDCPLGLFPSRSGARQCAASHGRSVPLVALPFGPCFPWPFFLLFLLDPWEVSTLSGWVSPPLRAALSLRLPEGLRFLPPPLPPGHWPALQPVESVT